MSAPPAGGGLNGQQRTRLAEATTLYQPVLLRAFSGQSKAAGVKAFCLSCVGFVRADVTNCTAHGCPLWPYRPYQRDDEPDDEAST